MKLKIEIRRNEDNIIATGDSDDYARFHLDDENEFDYFWWEDGNGSCDCVRRMMFHDFLDTKMIEENNCSDGLFSIRITNQETYEVLIDEFNKQSLGV